MLPGANVDDPEISEHKVWLMSVTFHSMIYLAGEKKRWHKSPAFRLARTKATTKKPLRSRCRYHLGLLRAIVSRVARTNSMAMSPTSSIHYKSNDSKWPGSHGCGNMRDTHSNIHWRLKSAIHVGSMRKASPAFCLDFKRQLIHHRRNQIINYMILFTQCNFQFGFFSCSSFCSFFNPIQIEPLNIEVYIENDGAAASL